MLILCCDTATDFGLFTIADGDGRIVASLTVRHHRNLSAQFFGVIDVLLQAANVRFNDIGAFAVGLGPGSFTGVRISVTSFRTLAQVTEKPLTGVCTLDIYAHRSRATHPSQYVAALLPSRRNELYVSLYAPCDSERTLYAGTVSRILDDLNRLHSEHGLIVCGPTGLLGQGLTAPFTEIDAPDGESMAQLAASAIANGSVGDPFSLNPLYVVPPAINQHLNADEASRLSLGPF